MWEKDKVYNLADWDEYMLYMERLSYYVARIKSRMPLEASRKAADAFK